MYQLPATTWNKIAQAVTLKQPNNRALFQLDQTKLLDYLDSQAKALTNAGYSPKVIKAYQTLGPLLMENEALSQYIMQTASLGLRSALPEICTPSEALQLATQEFHLSAQEQQQLSKLLGNLPH